MTLAEEMENKVYFAHEEGKKEGLKTGEKQAKEKIALKLKAAGMETAETAEITGLSTEEIEVLSQPFRG